MPENSRWPEKTTAIATVLAAIATVVGAIWIPIAIDKNAKTTRSVEIVGKAGRIIDKIVADKKKIDEDNKVPQEKQYSPDYINKYENKVQSLVFQLLNEYDGLCSAVDLDVIRADVFFKFRGDALTDTFRDYQAYIQAQRKDSKNAWTECDRIICRYAQAAK